MSSESVKKSGEITILFVNDGEIKRLNLRYLGKNNPTDVIAFDITEPFNTEFRKLKSYSSASGGKTVKKNFIRANLFADIVISTDRAIANAKTFKTTPLYELYLYVIHGVLHILGYDDKRKIDRLIMRKRQDYLLKSLNLSPITYHP